MVAEFLQSHKSQESQMVACQISRHILKAQQKWPHLKKARPSFVQYWYARQGLNL